MLTTPDATLYTQVNLLAETGGPRQRAQGGSDAGDSGTSTPRSMPGMSIEEFEIIKPISRGAFGRVYLARKLATGDLFAIKVRRRRRKGSALARQAVHETRRPTS